VVHAYGVPKLLGTKETRAHVLELVAQQESGRDESWRPDLPDDFFSALLRQIVAFRIEVERIETKFKLGQNRPVADRKNMATMFEVSEDPALRELGASIRRSLETQNSG
jgi:transcriptional regulator